MYCSRLYGGIILSFLNDVCGIAYMALLCVGERAATAYTML